ncbi:hypothetical protein B566_EDAN008588 [Ephemera danica]|nr:hypothetical protein B566_EDAN008588 [Ephemera danica]
MLRIFLLLLGLTVLVRGRLFTGQFVVQLLEHDRETARLLAADHGMRLLDTALEELDSGLFHFQDARLPTVSSSPALLRTRSLTADPRVVWAAQQELRHRQRRGHRIGCDVTGTCPLNISGLTGAWNFDDPFFSRQWYLLEDGVHADEAWSRGFTGRGVTAFVLDDGVQQENPEISANYEWRGSADVSDLRFPRPQPEPRNADDAHGTYCAAVIAGAANNAFCGVGVAFHARVGGVKLLGSGPLSDLQEAQALYMWQGIGDVASASWGPSDNGRSMEKPGRLAAAALHRGITKGRGGRGAVFVWAAGNGAMQGDNCNLDGYASSPFTLTIGALTNTGDSCIYSEPCAAVLTAVPVSGPTDMIGQQSSVVVPELDGGCRSNFQGTSAAAPLAAGLVALALQANPKLTWREVQHAVVLASRPVSSLDPKWRKNAAGHQFHPRQGFGSLHAGRLVDAALDLAVKPLPPRRHLVLELRGPPIGVRGLGNTTVALFTSPESIPAMSSVEHVVASVSLRHARRRNLEIWIVSPSGTESQVLTQRRQDNSTEGFENWPFLSVHFWGEQPWGVWRIVIANHAPLIGLLTALHIDLFGH